MRPPSLLAALLLAAIVGQPLPALARADLPGGRPSLARRLDALLSDPALAGDQVGLVVLDRKGEVRYARNARKRFLPASCRKVLTTACALSLLGPSYRIPTRVEALGPLHGDTVEGDLALIGAGDPSLDDAALAELARQVADLGIRRITGQVVGDGSAFSPAVSRPVGWSQDDLAWYYAPPIAALEADEDRLHLEIQPPASPTPIRRGDLAADPPAAGSPRVLAAPSDAPYVTVQPAGTPGSDLPDARIPVRVALASGPQGVEVEPTRNGLILEGQAQARAFLDLAAPRPLHYAAWRLEHALEAAGVRVEGRPPADDPASRWTDASPPGSAPPPSAWLPRILATHRSAPLSGLIARTNKPSDNLYAELLLRQIALAAPDRLPGTPPRPRVLPGDTLGRALAIERDWLGFDPGTFRLVDGSGLSRYDLLTPLELAAVLERMRSNTDFVASLPIAGRDGTLAGRLIGTPAAGVVRAKTGSMSGVSTLAGYVGDRWILVFMDNGHVGSLAPVRAVEDAVCLALVKAQDRPRRAPASN